MASQSAQGATAPDFHHWQLPARAALLHRTLNGSKTMLTVPSIPSPIP